ncbi:RnfH family protein [Simplicispira lacusdiani]|uniref:RnfH family protein n=1 Tax=Simplicispira lacusdiani TaxID=2213010 RepID=UPI000E734920|nr:RnfH family protein [Simplicispira lacusdiani]
MADLDGACLCITLVVQVAPGALQERELHLCAGATVADALLAGAEAGLVVPARAPAGVWGRVVERDEVLRAGDRIEVYRALTVDPKVARRQRFARQGARATGLFARQRPGGKAGY